MQSASSRLYGLIAEQFRICQAEDFAAPGSRVEILG